MNPDIAMPNRADRPHHRPASLRRLHRLKTLITQFGRQNLSTEEIAASMQCSHTAARNYINDLLRANVISALRRTTRPGVPGSRIEYRLTSYEQCVKQFLADIEVEQLTIRPSTPRLQRKVHLIERNGEHVDRHHDPIPCRDALVAALFGSAP